MTLSQIGMSIVRGVWSEDKRESGRMICQSNSIDPHLRNIRSMTESDSLTMSENLVGPGLMGEDRARSNESAIIIKSSLVEE